MGKKILKTYRLVLEELGKDHFDDLCDLLSNENVHQYFPKTLDKKESSEFLEKVQNRVRADGFSFWAVIRNDDKKFLGICGLLNQMVDGKEETEVAYRINDKYWGHGYGTEAAKGCLKYAKDVLQKKSVISLILPINQQSIRVAEKNNLIYEKESIFHEQLHSVYRINLKETKYTEEETVAKKMKE